MPDDTEDVCMAAPPPLPRDFPDRAIRDALVRPDNLRALLRRAVPELAERLDYSHLEIVQRSYLLDDWRRREADVLVSLPLLGAPEGQQVLICVLVEHLSGLDPVMPLRVLLYGVLHWEQQWQAWEQGHKYGVPLRLTPIIPVVFHTGQHEWNANRSLAELFAGPDELRVWAPQWPLRLSDLPAYTPADLLQAKEWWWRAMAVIRAERSDAAEFWQVFPEALRRLEALAGQDRVGWQQLLRLVLYWALFRRHKREHPQILDAVRASHANAELLQEAQTMAEQMDLTWEEELTMRGEARGRTAGALEMARETLLTQLRERFQTIPEALSQRIANADLPTLQAALRQVVHIQSPDELRLSPSS
jgi:hypothetical protein